MKEICFDDCIDYPKPRDIISGIKPGRCFEYVSSTYLNGFINYVDIIGGAMIQEYMNDEEFDEAIKRVEDFTNSDEWHTKFNNGKEYDTTAVIGKVTDICDIDENNTTDMYVIFIYDRDVSDCFIGGISANEFESDDEAYESFIQFVSENAPRFIKISKKFFRGWITG